MPTLYVLSGPEIGRQVDVGDGAVLGRADDCDAVMRDLSVSRRHARIERKRAGWRVVDLGSRNGLFKDGERVKKLFVEDGTEFRLGDLELRLRFHADESVEAVRVAPSANTELPSGLAETLIRPSLGSQFEADDESDAIEEDFEFADDTPVAAPAPRVAQAGVELEDPDEITLEDPDEIELEPDPAPDPAPPATATSGPLPPLTAPRAAAGPAAGLRSPIPPSRPTAAQRAGIPATAKTGGAQDPARKALQYHRVESHGGFLSADLSQYPNWVRFAAIAVALVLFAGLFLLAFRAAGAM